MSNIPEENNFCRKTRNLNVCDSGKRNIFKSVPKFSVEEINGQTSATTYYNFATKSNLQFQIDLPQNHDPLVFYITININAIDYKLRPGSSGNIANDIEGFELVDINENFVYDSTWKVGEFNGHIIPEVEIINDEFGTQFIATANEVTSHDIHLDVILEPDRYVVGIVTAHINGICPKDMNARGFGIKRI